MLRAQSVSFLMLKSGLGVQEVCQITGLMNWQAFDRSQVSSKAIM